MYFLSFFRCSLLSEYQKVMVQFTEQRGSLEKCLRAAREEADCLREQLRWGEEMSETSLYYI